MRARLRVLRGVFLFCALVIALRLFTLQILQGATYRALAEGQHAIIEQFVPRRGKILVRDAGDPTEYSVATTASRANVFAVPSKVEDAPALARAIAEILEFPDIAAEEPNSVTVLAQRLGKKDDPYEPIAQEVTDVQLARFQELNNPALQWVLHRARSYPEPAFGGHVLGFLGRDDAGAPQGLYGLEGYFNDLLAGLPGSLFAETDARGRIVGFGRRDVTPAVDGADLLISIDRTLQVTVCAKLAAAVERYRADGGAVVIIEPATGRIVAMCGAPDFSSANYGAVEDIATYNNPAIFTAYEPGSVFKPLTMAGAIEAGAVTPRTLFTDSGSVLVDDKTIRNADGKVYGTVDMVTVLEESINTGMVFVMRQMGREIFDRLVRDFGFGSLTGVTLQTESPGNIATLDDPAEVYAATAAFGQGITTTPLQLAVAYAALANDGLLLQPTIVDERRYADGTVERTTPTVVRQVVSPATATTIGAMLVSVVEEGHGRRAGVPGYYIAGKTGTAQIAEGGRYSTTRFNGTFAGYGPLHDPRFAMVVKIENPKEGVIYAESTAAPLFGDIAAFLLHYWGVPPDR